MYKQQQGEATEPPGQSGGRVQVQVLCCRTREQENLGGLLVGELRGRYWGGVIVNLRLTAEKTQAVYILQPFESNQTVMSLADFRQTGILIINKQDFRFQVSDIKWNWKKSLSIAKWLRIFYWPLAAPPWAAGRSAGWGWTGVFSWGSKGSAAQRSLGSWVHGDLYSGGTTLDTSERTH